MCLRTNPFFIKAADKYANIDLDKFSIKAREYSGATVSNIISISILSLDPKTDVYEHCQRCLKNNLILIRNLEQQFLSTVLRKSMLTHLYFMLLNTFLQSKLAPH